jgi:hypothetical protein
MLGNTVQRQDSVAQHNSDGAPMLHDFLRQKRMWNLPKPDSRARYKHKRDCFSELLPTLLERIPTRFLTPTCIIVLGSLSGATSARMFWQTFRWEASRWLAPHLHAHDAQYAETKAIGKLSLSSKRGYWPIADEHGVAIAEHGPGN